MPRGHVNLRRGLRDGELSTRYRRLRDSPEMAERDHNDWYDDDPDDQGIEYDTFWNPWRQTSPADFEIEKLWKGLAQIVESARTDVRLRDAAEGEKLVAALAEHVQRITSIDWQLAVAQQLDAPRAELRAAVMREPALLAWIARHRGPTLMLLLLSPFWVRSLDGWVAPSDDDAVLGRSLLEHLFARYPIPAPLFVPWTEMASPGLKWATWLVILGGGASLRRAASRFGWQVSAKLGHHLFDAPAGLEPIEAIMWAELVQRGGTEVELRRLRRHQAFVFDTTNATPGSDRAARYREFWIATVDWMVRHRDVLTDDTCQTILDWGMHRFTEDLARGTPAHECFSWSGRSPVAAHEAAALYAQQVSAMYGYVEHVLWSSHGWDWSDAKSEWSILELCSARELAAESAAMIHCVAGYSNRCASAASAIFSARFKKERAFTIELEPSTRRVVQARGTRNRECTAAEMAVVERWLHETSQSTATKE
ncbi:MAG: PcfJ domain-containing protein [Kofleriaceae bacterium]